ncbi:hypothetical protein ON010_g10356 [Phytophthora cinnamomi]|nr:hypothetical protein ON010_g10356 [Phytophthora cinnamomi]
MTHRNDRDREEHRTHSNRGGDDGRPPRQSGGRVDHIQGANGDIRYSETCTGRKVRRSEDSIPQLHLQHHCYNRAYQGPKRKRSQWCLSQAKAQVACNAVSLFALPLKFLVCIVLATSSACSAASVGEAATILSSLNSLQQHKIPSISRSSSFILLQTLQRCVPRRRRGGERPPAEVDEDGVVVPSSVRGVCLHRGPTARVVLELAGSLVRRAWPSEPRLHHCQRLVHLKALPILLLPTDDSHCNNQSHHHDTSDNTANNCSSVTRAARVRSLLGDCVGAPTTAGRVVVLVDIVPSDVLHQPRVADAFVAEVFSQGLVAQRVGRDGRVGAFRVVVQDHGRRSVAAERDAHAVVVPGGEGLAAADHEALTIEVSVVSAVRVAVGLALDERLAGEQIFHRVVRVAVGRVAGRGLVVVRVVAERARRAGHRRAVIVLDHQHIHRRPAAALVRVDGRGLHHVRGGLVGGRHQLEPGSGRRQRKQRETPHELFKTDTNGE